MFAVIKTGGKQYRVATDEKINIMHVEGNPGDIITFDQVLMLVDGDKNEFGAPSVAGASVAAAILEQARGPKVIAFKKRRRKHSKRKRGHKQDFTVVQITEILTGGAKPSRTIEVRKPASSIGDDIELIGGVGPTLGKRLRDAGITTWKQVAAWTPADVEKYDAELSLGGGAAREEWVEQAKELLAGKPPRAKADQERAAKDE